MHPAFKPLSPHLGIYRWQITNSLSILHRLTGVLLSCGALLLTVWLMSIAGGIAPYAQLFDLLRSPLGILGLMGATLCFFYHLANGIRHLCWDAGWGFEMRQVRLTGWAVIVGALILTALFWWVALAPGAFQS